MKQHNLALVILMALGVTACGSSGGTSSKAIEPAKATPPKVTEPTKVTPPKVTEPTKVTPPKVTEPTKVTPPKVTEPTKVTPPKVTEPAKVTPPKVTEPAKVTPPKVTEPAKVTPPKVTEPAKVTPPKVTEPAKVTPPKVTEPAKVTPPKVTEPAKVTPPVSHIEEIPAKDNIFSENANYKGTGFNFPRQKGSIDITGRTSSSNNKNFLKINDYIIEIFPTGFNTNNLKIQGANLTKLAMKNDHTLWSIIDDKSQKFIYIIANGVNPTQNIDALKGSIKYQGHGYHSYLEKNGSYTLDDSHVNMTADFDNKTIIGEIKSLDNSFKEVKFGAYITNNAFQGKMNEVVTEGGFFGSNAKEAIAQYQDPKGKSFGVFGVKKQ